VCLYAVTHLVVLDSVFLLRRVSLLRILSRVPWLCITSYCLERLRSCHVSRCYGPCLPARRGSDVVMRSMTLYRLWIKKCWVVINMRLGSRVTEVCPCVTKATVHRRAADRLGVRLVEATTR
jgi:hypothetical protein